MKDQKLAKKNTKGKYAPSNTPRLALIEVQKVMTKGASEYGRFNYSGKMKLTEITDAIERHNNKVLTFYDKDDIDESGYHHLAHIAANALMALDNILTGNIIDDRNEVYKQLNKLKIKN